MGGREELLEAVRSGDDTRVRSLLEADPSLAAVRDDDGISAVLNAHYRMRPDTVDILLAAGPELDVFEAAALGRIDRVAELLDGDPGLVAAWSPDGFTPLHLAAFFGHREAADLLLERGSGVGLLARNPMAVTPLHGAAAGSRHAVAGLLLEHDAEGGRSPARRLDAASLRFGQRRRAHGRAAPFPRRRPWCERRRGQAPARPGDG